jgi:hypothetical protein
MSEKKPQLYVGSFYVAIFRQLLPLLNKGTAYGLM